MTIDPELLEVMTQTIIVENPTPVTAYTPVSASGTPTPVLDLYGRHDSTSTGTPSVSGNVEWQAGVTYQCRLEYSVKIVPSKDGRDRKSSGRAYLAGFFPQISTEARLTVPQQVQPALQHPVIAFIENNYDETGIVGYNTTIHFE